MAAIKKSKFDRAFDIFLYATLGLLALTAGLSINMYMDRSLQKTIDQTEVPAQNEEKYKEFLRAVEKNEKCA